MSNYEQREKERTDAECMYLVVHLYLIRKDRAGLDKC